MFFIDSDYKDGFDYHVLELSLTFSNHYDFDNLGLEPIKTDIKNDRKK